MKVVNFSAASMRTEAVRNIVILRELRDDRTQFEAQLLRGWRDAPVPQRLSGFEQLSGRALLFAALFYLCILVDFDVI